MLQGDVTPLILTYNEEANIGRVLERLTWAPRILVVDSFSTDATLDIVRSFPQVDVVQRPFDSFADQCNFGLSQIDTEWVLSLDADYVCTEAFVQALQGLPPDPPFNGFAASFSYCIYGRSLRGTLYPDRVVLYRRSHARYGQDGHAHRVHIDGPIGKLAGRILHDDRKPLSSWFAAQQRYAGEEAAKLLQTPTHQLGLADRLRLRMLGPALAPLYTLFAKGVVLDGAAGWFYALQRTYAEIALALRLYEARRSPAGAGAASPPAAAAPRPAEPELLEHDGR